MNYFGMVMSFMVPGVVIGLTAAACAYDAAGKRRRRQAAVRRAQPRDRRGLYIYDMAEDNAHRAA